MSDERRSLGSGAVFLVAGVLLLTAGGLAVAVVPATECPVLSAVIRKTVAGYSKPTQIETLRKCRIRGHRHNPCAVCRSSCRVSLLRSWLAKGP